MYSIFERGVAGLFFFFFFFFEILPLPYFDKFSSKISRFSWLRQWVANNQRFTCCFEVRLWKYEHSKGQVCTWRNAFKLQPNDHRSLRFSDESATRDLITCFESCLGRCNTHKSGLFVAVLSSLSCTCCDESKKFTRTGPDLAASHLCTVNMPTAKVAQHWSKFTNSKCPRRALQGSLHHDLSLSRPICVHRN